MLNVFFPTSIKTGVAPTIKIDSAVAGNVKLGQKTISPLPIFNAKSDKISASVPLEQVTQ